MLLLLLLIFILAALQSQRASSIEHFKDANDLLDKKILFNERSKTSVKQNFIRAELLVPFWTYEFSVDPDIQQLIQRLPSFSQQLSLLLLLSFCSQFVSNSSGFIVNWMLFQIDHELQESQLKLSTIFNETSICCVPSLIRNPHNSAMSLVQLQLPLSVLAPLEVVFLWAAPILAVSVNF